MKSLLSTFLLLFSFFLLQAQVTEVVSGVSGPWDILVDNDTLYISENGANKISKIDLTESTPTPVDVITDLNGATGIELNGRTFYYGERLGSRVIKFDLSTLARINVTSMNNDNAVSGLHRDENNLYVAERTGDTLWVANLDQVASKEAVVTGIQGAYGMARHNNDLYIAELTGNRISKVDLDTKERTTFASIPGGPIGLLVRGDELYVCEHNAGIVSSIDLTSSNPAPSTFATGLEGPFSMAIHNNELYISEFTSGKISKIALPTTSIAANSESQLEVYPNPTRGNFSIKLGSITASARISLSDLTGKLLHTEVHDNCEVVHFMTDQPSGVYLLTVESEGSTELTKLVIE